MSRIAQQTDRFSPAAWTVLPRTLGPAAAAVGVALVMYLLVGPMVGPFNSKMLLLIGINVILAVSLTVVNGFTGQFSIGHAGFMAVGGYVAAGLTYYGSIKFFGGAGFAGGTLSWTGSGSFTGPVFGRGDVLFVVSCLAGGLAAAGAGYVVGLPSLRLRGDYLAIVTLGFGEIASCLGTSTRSSPGGAEAMGLPAWDLAIAWAALRA